MGNTCSTSSGDSYLEKYKILKQVGQGGCGYVYKCLDTETKEIVAIKKKWSSRDSEASMLKILMDKKLDQCNIVKFYHGFWGNQCLVFEKLDISLKGYLSERKVVMRLQDVRTVIQQLAVAFDALKKIGVIHNGVKPDNIMLVDRVRQPFSVKLIDFDMAVFRSRAKRSEVDHGHFYRAPEIILGLPFSEAIDMWSLGCVMAKMVVGLMLFPGRNDYELLRYIIDLLGPPPDCVINAGMKSGEYFIQTVSQHWKFMEYWTWGTTDNRRYTFRSLDEVIAMYLEKIRKSDADETKECINLLKALLKWDAGERITPSEVLAHPFITRSYLNKSSSLNNYDSILESTSTESGLSQTDKPSMNQAAEPGIWDSTTLPRGVIMVKPAPLENRIPLMEEEQEQEVVVKKRGFIPISD